MTQAYNKRVSEMAAGTSATEDDTLYLVQGGASRKISVRALIDSSVLSTSAGVAAAIEGRTLASKAALEAADIPAGASRVAVKLGGTWVDAHRVASDPGHELAAQSNDGQWWEFRPPFVTSAMASSVNAAAEAAFALGVPLQQAPGETARIIIDPTADALADTDEARHAVIQDAVNWASTCRSPITGAEASIRIVGGGHKVYGQISVGSYETGGEGPTITLECGSADYDGYLYPDLINIRSITYAAKRSEVIFLSVPNTVGNGGSGYTTASVSFSGGGGSGAAATATIEGGEIVGWQMTNGGSGYTSAPTCSITGDGTGAATPVATINANIQRVSIEMDSLPARAVVGMPVGFYLVAGANDEAWINGGAIVDEIDTSGAYPVIKCDMTFPNLLTAVGGVPTAGTVVVPHSWLEVTGGYTGVISAKEGYVGAGNGGRIKLKSFWMRWVDGARQKAKLSVSGVNTGIFGRLHFYAFNGIVGFPSRQIRMAQSGGYGSVVFLGGGKTGSDGLFCQNAGDVQFPTLMVGSLRGDAITIADGTYGQFSSGRVGGCVRAVYAAGGDINHQTCKIAGATTGLQAAQGSTIYCGTSDTIDRCGTAIRFDAHGNIVGNPTITNCTTTANPNVAINTRSNGGQWIASTAANVSYQVAGVSFQTGASVTADKGTATDAGSGVTISKMAGAVTTQSLMTAAGASTTVVVTNTLATTTCLPILTIVGGTNSAGSPHVSVSNRAAGSFTITIENRHAVTMLNGTLVIAFLLIL